MSKIMVGLPTKGEIKTDTAMCLMNMAAKIGTFVTQRAFAAVDEARNMIVDAFLKSDCTHLLFIDWDATFPPHAAQMLLEADKPIIGVNAAKHETGNPVITHNIAGEPLNYIHSKIEQVHAIGMHVTLIQREVLEKLPWPWFFRYILENEKKMATEDFTFCKNAHQNYGFEVFVHNRLSIEIGHISSNQIKTLEHVVNNQIEKAEKLIMKKKIEKQKDEAEKLLKNGF